MKTDKKLDAPLGIVAMRPEGPWHVVAHIPSFLGADVTYAYKPNTWLLFGSPLCGRLRRWRYLRLPADLPPGARLCKRCEKALKEREER